MHREKHTLREKRRKKRSLLCFCSVNSRRPRIPRRDQPTREAPTDLNDWNDETDLDELQVTKTDVSPSCKTERTSFRNLGRNGLRISQLGLGTWVTFGGQISDDVAEELLTVAYENGVNLFDTAEVYAAGK